MQRRDPIGARDALTRAWQAPGGRPYTLLRSRSTARSSWRCWKEGQTRVWRTRRVGALWTLPPWPRACGPSLPVRWPYSPSPVRAALTRGGRWRAVQGHERVRKAELVARGVVRKVTEPAAGSGAQAGTAGAVRHLSRPGSAYVRVEESPFGRAPAPRPMVSRPKLFSRKGSSAGLPGIESCIDPLADEPSPPQAKQRGLAALHL